MKKKEKWLYYFDLISLQNQLLDMENPKSRKSSPLMRQSMPNRRNQSTV
jgi:hypothetical protein